ncbi:MAG TPA: acetyl-CoA carboxylase biotin carboxylase subunit, partial [Chloroflexota bacterium]|nr:acetyl-CoA carboxylase biotin carboxylase subunit [Chloroflexota bacterium]
VRIIRCCHELGIETICVYSEADRDSLAVRLADHPICIGPAPSARSYLHIPSVIQAALLTGAEAIHPGAGFLAEDAKFAEICEQYGIVFVGPSAAVLKAIGEKTQAKRAMQEAGVPVIPGSDDPSRSVTEASRAAEQIGYPVMLKPAGGGGGKGMRIATTPEELERLFPLSQSEAAASFGNDGVYLERYLERMRHIEVQILADGHGHILALGDRNCSAQRFHQKLVEEAPSPNVPDAARQALWASAVRGAAAINYSGAGTFEFLVDEQNNHYFLEVNKRIQVEHPVTEAITGMDLVKEQLRIADGEALRLTQDDVVFRGHAIECRINAEDPSRKFQAQTGRVTRYLPPGGPGIRVDSHLFAGYVVPPFYDSLVAKIIAWGADRSEALARLTRSLDECWIEGVTTNIAFQRWLLGTPQFIDGTLTTEFVSQAILEGLPFHDADLALEERAS